MMQYNLLKPKERKFVFLDNIIHIVAKDTEFYNVLLYSFINTICIVALAYVFGLVLALLLNRDIKFRGVFRALVLIPWVIPPVVAATNWRWILNDQVGIVNIMLINSGLISSPILFLGEATLAKLTCIVTGAWKAFPFMTIVIMAGLQSIPKELYEAADLDGAGLEVRPEQVRIRTLKQQCRLYL